MVKTVENSLVVKKVVQKLLVHLIKYRNKLANSPRSRLHFSLEKWLLRSWISRGGEKIQNAVTVFNKVLPL